MDSSISLEGKTIALLASNGFEDSELTEPRDAVAAAGADVVIVSDQEDAITGKDGTKVAVNAQITQVAASDYDGLLLPGGVANPDHLRMDSNAVSFVRDFFDQHKPVAAICHAPWLLIEAEVIDGRTVTSWPSLKTDITNAGGEWVDEEVVVDAGLVTSRKPEDLDAFCEKAIEEFAEGEHETQTV